MWSPYHFGHSCSYNIYNNRGFIHRVNNITIFYTFCLILFNYLFLLTRRGSLLGTSIFVYAVTSPINGYFGGSLYAKMGGRIWIRQMLLSAFLLPSMVCGMAFLINFIAIYYHASRAIPFGSMVRNYIYIQYFCIILIKK